MQLSPSATKEEVKIEIAKILHGEVYLKLWESIPVNVEVYLRRKHRMFGGYHDGVGKFTVAVESVGRRFLQEYGGERPVKTIRISRLPVVFRPSNGQPSKGIIYELLRTPYVDPHEAAQKQKRIAEAEAKRIPIGGIEFGWECRDTAFSCEWERTFLDPDGFLGYDEDRREFRVDFGSKLIALRLSQINWASCGTDGPCPVICFNLDSPPIFEKTIRPGSSHFKRTRISSLGPGHDRVVAYASLALRLVCRSKNGLEMFRALCSITNFRGLSEGIYYREDRHLFSAELERQLGRWLEQLDLEVAFQVEKIVRDASVDFQEILAIREPIGDLLRSKGAKHTIGVLRSFHSALKEYEWDDHPNYIPALFLTVSREYVPEIKSLADMALEDTFSCYHVSVTPTAMKFTGPFQEQSNRVFRRYPDHHSCFIRVTFEEETRLQLRFDREVDGAAFVRKRYGTILRETGLKIGGRTYRFLAYSQSALKDHSVWFMRPFRNKDRVLVDTGSIISSLGDFATAAAGNLIRCPGRYGARISQAFTSTHPGVSVQPEEIREAPDIQTPGGNFTDGVGTISRDLSKEISIRLNKRRGAQIYNFPFQIRLDRKSVV